MLRATSLCFFFALMSFSAVAQNVLGTFAHFAVNNGWTTRFVVVNTSTTKDASMTLVLYGAGGNLTVDGGTSFSVPAGGSVTKTLADNGGSETAGWAQLITNDVTVIPGEIQGMLTFVRVYPGVADTEVSIPLTKPTSCVVPIGSLGIIRIPFDNSGHLTALAFTNMSNVSQAVPVVFLSQLGKNIGTATLSLPAKGHISFGMVEKYPALAGTAGTIVLTADPNQIAPLAIWFNAKSGTLASVLPIIQ